MRLLAANYSFSEIGERVSPFGAIAFINSVKQRVNRSFSFTPMAYFYGRVVRNFFNQRVCGFRRRRFFLQNSSGFWDTAHNINSQLLLPSEMNVTLNDMARLTFSILALHWFIPAFIPTRRCINSHSRVFGNGWQAIACGLMYIFGNWIVANFYSTSTIHT